MHTQSTILLAEKTFLTNSDLDQIELKKILSNITNSRNIDFADLYFQTNALESWYLEDHIVKSGSYGFNKGVGIRTISQDRSALAFSEDLTKPLILEAAAAAASITSLSPNTTNKVIQINSTKPSRSHNLYENHNPLSSISDQEKIILLKTINELARAQDPRISQVTASLVGSSKTILIVASDGTYTADLQPLIRLSINVIAEHNSIRTQGGAGGGGRFANYNIFTENNFSLTRKYIEQAVHIALTNLGAIEAPAGNMPVVLGPGWPGVLLHEAIGHGLEGDAIRKGSSVFTNKLGHKIANDLCTIVDRGCINNRRGSLNIDDEGTQSQNTILVEKGILQNFLQDKLNAKLMGQKSTGNGRRQSYAYLPIPRMTNTYMLAGESSPQDIIKTVNKGIYAVNFAGGQVDVTSGKFVFEANEAYLIENGKVTAPVKNAILIGNGPEILHKVTMVGDDLQLDPGIGTCGKDGQSVPVGVGQPTLLINELTIGGTKC